MGRKIYVGMLVLVTKNGWMKFLGSRSEDQTTREQESIRLNNSQLFPGQAGKTLAIKANMICSLNLTTIEWN